MSTLYLVATPIGNLEDFTYRAENTLNQVDAILAEDKRVSSKLLSHYKIKKPLLVWQQHSKESDWQRIKSLLAEDKNLALVTDAGTPGVSDPGGQLIAKVLEEFPEVDIVPIPGASALTALMSVAGIALDKFLFLGFLPHKKGRQTMLLEIKESKIPVIFFESVHRILKTLDALVDCDKQIILGRELTKQFETIYRGTAKEIKEVLEKNPGQVKGEFVLIVK
ncbi:16S rRNA (cytidine(1402)-2'-O)-methyltransferase [Candidatus Nomurabacteria bacterium]|nr:16S rRNA (cytidine(1402)-2'-O)-methyltransferase [Candidatus Nomurabacteria bacterium]